MIKSSSLVLLVVLAVSFCLISKIESFNPSGVPLSTRQGWCTQNTAVCPNYCKDNGTSGATVNQCDPNSCTYQCVCSNGQSPDPKLYTMPMDFFKCTSDQENCTYSCGAGDQQCVNTCTGNCSATLKKTYTYALPSSTPGPMPSSSTSGYHSSPSSLLTPNLANKSTPAITIGFLIVFLTSISVFLFRL